MVLWVINKSFDAQGHIVDRLSTRDLRVSTTIRASKLNNIWDDVDLLTCAPAPSYLWLMYIHRGLASTIRPWTASGSMLRTSRLTSAGFALMSTCTHYAIRICILAIAVIVLLSPVHFTYQTRIAVRRRLSKRCCASPLTICTHYPQSLLFRSDSIATSSLIHSQRTSYLVRRRLKRSWCASPLTTCIR
jgi:hypothetical protein